jgi:hypothetical protein
MNTDEILLLRWQTKASSSKLGIDKETDEFSSFPAGGVD